MLFYVVIFTQAVQPKDIAETSCHNPPGGARVFQAGYHPRLIKRTLKTHPKHVAYISGMKIDLKYAFLHAFFLLCASCPFQNLSL